MVQAFLLMFVCFMSIHMNAHKLHICVCLKAIKYLIYCGMFYCISTEQIFFTCADITNPSPFLCLFNTNQLMKRCGFAYAIWRKKILLLSIETCMKTELLWQFLKYFSFRALFCLSAVVADSCLLPHKTCTYSHTVGNTTQVLHLQICALVDAMREPFCFSPTVSPSPNCYNQFKKQNKMETKTTELFLFLCSHFSSSTKLTP